jgi:hypothetical protein
MFVAIYESSRVIPTLCFFGGRPRVPPPIGAGPKPIRLGALRLSGSGECVQVAQSPIQIEIKIVTIAAAARYGFAVSNNVESIWPNVLFVSSSDLELASGIETPNLELVFLASSHFE